MKSRLKSKPLQTLPRISLRIWPKPVSNRSKRMSLVTPLSYEAKPVAGRPRPVLEVIEEGPLTQIETDPKFMA